MKRIFIAVKTEPNEALLSMIADLKSVLKAENIRWSPPENLHITLAFLGDTEEKRIEALVKMLGAICNGWGDFELILKGAGVFKNLSDPRIIWTGIELSDELKQLNSRITIGLKENGIVIEDHPFKPHLTLGRIKRITDTGALKSVISKYADIIIQREVIGEVILYESILLPSGPVYKAISKFCLHH